MARTNLYRNNRKQKQVDDGKRVFFMSLTAAILWASLQWCDLHHHKYFDECYEKVMNI